MVSSTGQIDLFENYLYYIILDTECKLFVLRIFTWSYNCLQGLSSLVTWNDIIAYKL